MEKSRAIELLKLAVPIKALTQQEYSDFVEAVNMGMDALEAQLSRENATSDTISRQAAIDALNEYFARIGKLKRRGLTKGEEAISLDTVGAIKTLPPAQPEPAWIPVERELPEVGQTVIAQCRAGIIKTLKLDSNGDWYQDAEHCYLSGFVVAWMPLPTPYTK